MPVKKGNVSHLSLKRQLRASLTPAETKLWFHLRAKRFENLKFKRQHGIGPYIVDYYCSEKALVIEIDGDVHAYEEQIVKDRVRSEYLEKLGLRIVRYTNEEVLKNIHDVLQHLQNLISDSSSTAPNPLLTKEGGEDV